MSNMNYMHNDSHNMAIHRTYNTLGRWTDMSNVFNPLIAVNPQNVIWSERRRMNEALLIHPELTGALIGDRKKESTKELDKIGMPLYEWV